MKERDEEPKRKKQNKRKKKKKKKRLPKKKRKVLPKHSQWADSTPGGMASTLTFKPIGYVLILISKL